VVSLTFTPENWNVPQTVTVTGVDDLAEDGDVAYAIITAAATSSDPAYNGLDASNVSVTNLDDEVAAVLSVTGISPGSMLRGTTISVTISGSGFQPGAGVTFENFPGATPAATNVVVVNAMTITADVTVGTNGPNKDRVGDVRVTNPDGSSDACVGCFTVTVSANSRSLAAASESSEASFQSGTLSKASGDDSDLISIATPLPATDTRSTALAGSGAVATSTDEADLVDEAMTDFDASPLDDALLEGLAVSLVG